MSPLALHPGMHPAVELLTKVAIVVQLASNLFCLGVLAWGWWTYSRRGR